MRIKIGKPVGEQTTEVRIHHGLNNDGQHTVIYKTNDVVMLEVEGHERAEIQPLPDGSMTVRPFPHEAFKDAMYKAFLEGVTTTSYANGSPVPSADGVQKVFRKFWKEWAGE